MMMGKHLWRSTFTVILLGILMAGCTLRDNTVTITPATGPGPTALPVHATETAAVQGAQAAISVTPSISTTKIAVATKSAVNATASTDTATATAEQATAVTPIVIANSTNPKLSSPLPAVSIPLETIFGVELDHIDAAANLPLVKNAGARWIRRVAVPWRLVEPEEGQRKWDAIAWLESEFRIAAEQGFKLVIVVRETPAFAQSIAGNGCSAIKQDKLGAFASFMRDLVSRYSQPPYNVRYWEIGNEPDIDPRLVSPNSLWGCWGNSDDAYYGGGYYGEMLKVIYPAMKQAEPSAQVMVGGLLLDCDPRSSPASKDCKPSLFLEGILRSGGGAFLDGVAFHAYDYYDNPKLGDYYNPGWNATAATTGPVVGVKAQFLRETLSRYGYTDKFLMDTEMSLVCGKAGTDPRCLAQEFTDTKAAYVAQSYITSLAHGLRAAIWYTLNGWRGSGLIGTDLKPNTAYASYRYAAQQFQGTTELAQLQLASGLRGYELRKGDARVWVVWATDGSLHNLSLSAVPTGYFDCTGKQLSNGTSQLFGPMPIYLNW